MKSPKLSPRDARLRRQFNITEAEYNAIVAFQGGLCPICGKPPKAGGVPLNVDHCHKSGLTRGAIHGFPCNKGLALFRDDPKMLRAAADYLESPPAVVAIGARYGRLGGVGIKKATRRRLERAAEKRLHGNADAFLRTVVGT